MAPYRKILKSIFSDERDLKRNSCSAKITVYHHVQALFTWASADFFPGEGDIFQGGQGGPGGASALSCPPLRTPMLIHI